MKKLETALFVFIVNLKSQKMQVFKIYTKNTQGHILSSLILADPSLWGVNKCHPGEKDKTNQPAQIVEAFEK